MVDNPQRVRFDERTLMGKQTLASIASRLVRHGEYDFATRVASDTGEITGRDIMLDVTALEGLRKLGDPAEYAERYDRQGIDEIILLDIVASLYGRNSLHDLIERTTARIMTPVTVGGGVRSIEDVRQLLRAGADKVAINTAALKRPELITEIATKFGSQCCVLQIDAKKIGQGIGQTWQAWCEGGRENTGKDAIAWAQEGEARGAGEILVTSIDQEGTRSGPDLALISRIVRCARTPVVAAGGIGASAHITAAAQSGCSGVAISSLLHFEIEPLAQVRRALDRAGVAVRHPMKEIA